VLHCLFFSVSLGIVVSKISLDAAAVSLATVYEALIQHAALGTLIVALKNEDSGVR